MIRPSIHNTHTRVQCSPANLGLAQTCPNNLKRHFNEDHEVAMKCSQVLCFALSSHVIRSSVEPLMHFLQVNTELRIMVSKSLLQSNYSELQAWTVMSSTVNFNLRLLGQQPCSQSTSTLFLCVLVGMQDCGTYETTIVLVP